MEEIGKNMILTWKVNKRVSIPCPDIKKDTYTGEISGYGCLAYHYKDITEDMSAEFSTLKKCKDFAAKAPISCYDFRVNGKKIKDTRDILHSTSSNITIFDSSVTAGGNFLKTN